MDILRKSLKAYILVLALFAALTFVLAALITFTGFAEEWAGISLIVVLTAACFLIAFLEGAIIGRRGLFVGIAAQALFLLIIILVLNIFLADDFSINTRGLFLPVQVLSGAIGGVVGANRNK